MKLSRYLKVSFCFDKLFYITAVLSAALFLLTFLKIVDLTLPVALFMAFAFMAISVVRFEITDNCFVVSYLAIPLLNSVVATIIVQLLACGSPFYLGITNFILNVVLNSIGVYLILTLTNSLKISLIIGDILLFSFSMVDYAVKYFRGGTAIKFNDFFSLNTALSVASSYKFKLNYASTTALLMYIAVIFFICVSRIPFTSAKAFKKRILSGVSTLLSVLIVALSLVFVENELELWGYYGSMHNGLTYNLLIEAANSRVSEPVGFSKKKVDSILSQHQPTKSDHNTPHILVIMSESFTDLSVLGDFETSEDPIEYYNSINDNCIKGFTLSSVYGGNTATSEWEFLTGNTQAFMPAGSIVYQQFMEEGADSIVEIMENNGYTTIGMHPYSKFGWNRAKVYEIFGFDEVYFEDELSNTEIVRKYVSDKTFFSDIINRFENKKEGEKLFTFAITMQNHGGYYVDGLEHTVTVEGGNYDDVDQYLTIIDKSDNALSELIAYFENYTEDTMIVFFGDHQPTLSNEFYRDVMKNGGSSYDKIVAKHTVPFFIWTNYESEESSDVFTSINYLPLLMLKKAGIGLTPYFSYLDSVMNKIPIISGTGYYSKSKNRIMEVSEAEGEEKAIIDEYRLVQYDNVFKTEQEE